VKPSLFSPLYPNIYILGPILSAAAQLPGSQATPISGPTEAGINPADNLNQQPVSSSNGLIFSSYHEMTISYAVSLDA